MFSKVNRKAVRFKKRLRVRKKIEGSAERPRLSVYRSLNHIYAQIINDENGTTMVAASTLDPTLREGYGGNIEAARKVGELIAQRALSQGIKQVVFDRGGFIYHGRIAALADAARTTGLEF
ncbi:MAG: 50S ribosomal protein L18 [Firmicutes bacterium]|nr:50S ribosomal protein L18 [Bacillota bacterium]